MVGPITSAPAQKRFILVTTDYFTKCVEIKAFANVKDNEVKNFLWKNIVCRFSIRLSVISDNGDQFESHLNKELTLGLKIKHFLKWEGRK